MVLKIASDQDKIDLAFIYSYAIYKYVLQQTKIFQLIH